MIYFFRKSVSETSVDIPDREWYKAAEVCEIAALQPYVLRSWEKEFPTLGVAKAGSSARAYRRADVDLVLRIKQLVFGEGLTLAGVRRRLDGELQVEEPVSAPVVKTAPETKKALADIKSELKAILAILDGRKAHSTATRWPRPKGQPTLLDLDAEQHDNGVVVGGAAEAGSAARPAAKKPRRTPQPPAS